MGLVEAVKIDDKTRIAVPMGLAWTVLISLLLLGFYAGVQFTLIKAELAADDLRIEANGVRIQKLEEAQREQAKLTADTKAQLGVLDERTKNIEKSVDRIEAAVTR